jgi:hypothetical protein
MGAYSGAICSAYQIYQTMHAFSSSFAKQIEKVQVVGMMGLEPIRCYHQRILSPLRLPIPPHPQLEVPIGFEPMITELQSIALPLG